LFAERPFVIFILGAASGASAPTIMTQSQNAKSLLERMRTASTAPSTPNSKEQRELRDEIALSEEGHRQSGQLNPRPPGVLNSAAQFGKKVMRRSLTWYTRPLHVFQGAVIRALQHTANILDEQRGQLHRHSEALALQADVIERNHAELAELARVAELAGLAELAEQTVSQEQALQDIRQQMEQMEAAFRQQMEQMEAAFALHNTRISDAVDGQFRQLREESSRRNADLRSDISRLQDERQELSQQIEALRAEFPALRATLQEVDNAGRRTSTQLRVRERDLRRLLNALGPEKVQPAADKLAPVPPMFPSEIKNEAEFDYFAFEEQYRGDEPETRKKQQIYLDYFRDREDVVDIGCGRGEFLDALRDAGIKARGVELGTDQILICQEKGLDVVQQDLFAFLESTPDDSLGGIFSAQVIEHMTASDQLRYVALAYRKCKAGSPVIFETINPECVYALVRNFFLDPTHVRPVHPGTLQFAMESAGFRNVELRFSAPETALQVPRLTLEGNVPGLEQFNAGITRVNDLLYGFQDFAVIGWK
jgi:O-antigen chain-terminating methyltransferase